MAHVPHYLAQLEYPKAALAILEQVELGGHLTIDLGALRAAAEEREVEITGYLEANEEVRDVVAGLEQQMPTPSARRRGVGRPDCWPVTNRCPPARRSAVSSSSSWPDWTAPTPTPRLARPARRRIDARLGRRAGRRLSI